MTWPRPRDFALLLRAWLELLIVASRLRLLPWRRAARRGGNVPARHDPALGDGATVERIVRLIDLAARCHPWRMTCLSRSLALHRLLERRGYACEVRIGVSRRPHGLQAHAWVERGGRPVGEPAEVARLYAPLVLLGRPHGAEV